jgi:uncharacterized protein YjbI with pentapeptide repeats
MQDLVSSGIHQRCYRGVMVEEKGKQAEERHDEPRLWRPWQPPRRRRGWRVLWAVGTLFTLVTIALLVALLVVNLDALKWEDLSRARREQVALFIGIAVALTTLFVLLAIGGASLGWTGFGDKTVWDWLQLLSALAIPVVLAAAGLWFTAQQDARQQKIEGQRARQAQNIEDQRAEAERDLAKQRAQDEALQAYLGQMSQLLLEQDLRGAKEGSVVRTLARARTIVALQRLDAEHNQSIARFLGESKLSETDGTTIGLLRGASLENADLAGVDLENADLSGAHLREANLKNANLDNANLEGADVRRVNMKDATLDHANMHNLFAFDVNLSGALLLHTNLSGPDTYLSNANLSNANLTSANLSDVWLDFANLSDTSHVTQKQLDSCKSLEGTTMPNGKKYEDSLKGEYVTTEFEPAFRLEFGKAGWAWKGYGQTSDEVRMLYVPESWGQLIFASPVHVFDPSNLSESKEVPAPETVHEWVSWFQSHPNLETSNPVPESVGGVSGMRIDVTCVPGPREHGYLPCSPPFPIGFGLESIGTESYTQGTEAKDRYIIVDVRGETVLIDVAPAERKFDEFLPKAQKVLDTVEWKSE